MLYKLLYNVVILNDVIQLHKNLKTDSAILKLKFTDSY